ncbi:MAG TPA: ABC transporter permease [Gemmatimonadaceae bacterium]
MSLISRDVRFAVRALRRSPGFTFVAVLTLALGIGATTVIFSAVNRLLLEPLPFTGGDRLVYVWRQNPNASFMVWPSAAVTDAWMHDAHSFDGIQPNRGELFQMDRPEGPIRVRGTQVLPGFLAFLGLTPALGRMFSPDEARPGAAQVVLLGYDFWHREFGGRPDILGRTIKLDDALYTVIGVMPKRLALFEDADVWNPLTLVGSDTAVMGYGVLARLRPGFTPEQAQRELDAIAARVPDKVFGDWKTRVLPPQHFLGGTLQSALPILLGAVGFVLLIACANVALLLLARGAAREREIAIRLSLGAGRRRVARQMLVESACIAVAGGALGLLLAWWGVHALTELRPASLSDLAHIGIDAHVLLFALILVMGTAIVSGVLPALRATDVSLGAALKSGTPGSGGAAGSGRVRSVLVAGEMMLSVVLLVGAGLLVRSLIERQRADLGFAAGGLITARMTLPKGHYSSTANRIAFADELLARARSLPGVTGATFAMSAPPQYGVMGLGDMEVEGRGPLGPTAPRTIAIDMVSPDYFGVVGIPVLGGRTFGDAENRIGAQVVVISKGMADRLFPGENAVGKRVRSIAKGPKPAQWMTVIGVVGDVAAMGISGERRHLQWYQPFGQGPELPGAPPDPGTLIVRTSGDAAALAPLLRGLVHSIDPNVPAPELATVASHYSELLAAPRFNTILLGLFAALALVLAAVGLFGVLSYAVAQRTREIGIRVALGAQTRDVRALIVRQGMIPAIIGLALGAIAAFFTTRVLASLLYGVAPHDTTAFVGACVVLVATAFTACYVPARRATRVDPLVALREE